MTNLIRSNLTDQQQVDKTCSLRGIGAMRLKSSIRFLLAAVLLATCCAAGLAQDGVDPELPQGTAPWERPSKLNPVPLSRINSPATYLENYDIDESHMQAFFHGQPLEESENETLFRLLYRVPQIGRERIERWRDATPAWDELIADPESHRTHIYRLHGRVKKIEQFPLLEEAARAYEFDHYFRVDLELTNDNGEPTGKTALVCTRRFPQAWPVAEGLDFKAECDGLFVKVGETNGDADQLVFISDRIAWMPESTSDDVSPNWVFLASKGFDVGLFDDVRRRNRQPIGSGDRECFYQLLATVSRCTPEELLEQADHNFELAPLLVNPQEQHGKIKLIEGNARKITRIIVSDRDIQARFGIDHYYQIDFFIPLGDQVIRLGNEGDENAPVYESIFPGTLCVTRLPDAWKEYEGSEEAGEFINEKIRLPAVYFKLWSYRSQYVSQADKSLRQPSPMFIGIEPVLVQEVQTNTQVIGFVIALIVVLSISGVWFAVWRFNGEDSKFADLRDRKGKDDKSLNELDIKASDGPDFSGLD